MLTTTGFPKTIIKYSTHLNMSTFMGGPINKGLATKGPSVGLNTPLRFKLLYLPPFLLLFFLEGKEKRGRLVFQNYFSV